MSGRCHPGCNSAITGQQSRLQGEFSLAHGCFRFLVRMLTYLTPPSLGKCHLKSSHFCLLKWADSVLGFDLLVVEWSSRQVPLKRPPALELGTPIFPSTLGGGGANCIPILHYLSHVSHLLDGN